MRKDLFVFIALLIALIIPPSGWPQSSTSALMSTPSGGDFKALLTRANSGNPGAQFALGLVYEQGNGVNRSEDEAMRWYRLAAGSGHTGAQNNLAYLYETGSDGLRSMAEAVKW